MIKPEEALEYHRMGRHGKIEVVSTKPVSTQRDLSLAYSPGVAEPCREIALRPPNVLIFPNIDAGNIACKLLMRIGECEAIGPLLMGMNSRYTYFRHPAQCRIL